MKRRESVLPIHASHSDAVLVREKKFAYSSGNTRWYMSDMANGEFVDEYSIDESYASLPPNFKCRFGESKHSKKTLLRPRSAEYGKQRSPELSCFGRSRVISPDSDEDVSCKKRSDDGSDVSSFSGRARSRLLQRIFSHRGSSASPLRHPASSVSMESSSSKEGDGSYCQDSSQELNVKINRYSRLMQKDRSPYYYGESCQMPPLAVFLSDEDISATVFPLRHVVSEPATNKSCLLGSSMEAKWQNRKERPKSDYISSGWVKQLRHQLNGVQPRPKSDLGK